MSRDFPDWVNPDKAAAAERVFVGSVTTCKLARLAGLIVEGEPGELRFELRFHLDGQRQSCVDVTVEGEVPMQCQRTLATYRQPISSRSLVGIVGSEQDAEALPEDYEVRLCPDARLELLDLVEEELLLALPLVPVSPDSERVSAPPSEHEVQRPFAALAGLKKSGE